MFLVSCSIKAISALVPALSWHHLCSAMAKKRGPGRPRKRKSPSKSLGKASSLPGDLWFHWLRHVLAEGSSWLYVALLLSHVLCLRISEVLRLQAKDFDFRGKCARIKEMKGGPEMHKHILNVIMPTVKALRDKGVVKKRKQNRGVFGMVTFMDRWQWPVTSEAYLFPSDRADSLELHRVKDTVCKSIARLRKTFAPPNSAFLNVNQIRSHSGRHRFINDCKTAGLPDMISMNFARITDQRTDPVCLRSCGLN